MKSPVWMTQAGVGADGQRRGVGDRVSHADRLHFEAADLDPFAGHDLVERDVIEDLVVRGPLADEAERIARSVDGHVEPAKEVRDRADVVFVPVRDEETGHSKALERREIRVDHVDPEVAVIEGDAAVDDQGLFALRHGKAVHPDFSETAEREDPNRSHGAVLAYHALGGSPSCYAWLATGCRRLPTSDSFSSPARVASAKRRCAQPRPSPSRARANASSSPSATPKNA